MSLRLEAEQAMGLRFPERNGEAVIRFEETMEVPHGAEVLMRGLYRDPDDIKKGFKNLHQETATLLELLMPRRARLKEWLEELPEQPKEAESFLRETSEKIQHQDRKVSQLEHELISKLVESGLEDLFPLPLSAFATLSYTDPCAKIFLRPLGRLAEILKLSPEVLRQVVRVHFLYSLLILAGQDLDGQSCQRGNEDAILIGIASFFTLKHLKKHPPEFQHCYGEWVKAWGGKSFLRLIAQESSVEKVRAAMIFWRRNPELSWDSIWNGLQSFELEKITSPRPLSSWPVR
ncbi:hypothetical protein Dhaf_3072 [Desulfitobacterium hafniense DCB-2]|uniref:Uncharacterized protein n=1 Tax=Desulfitobacterium hafniense (strain DSM 10664 / DCB-2) TaxID=272564 RepID=B8G034_DESHD|nr:hypothetical protein [Desulfitobacterium hafniense]ACL21095.1 hypothetical protein Dhaf_3072 [Desulfitobacterium hafniense DCB-2]